MPTTMKLIAKQTLGSSAASVVFSGIPSTYTDLVIAASVRGDRAAGTDAIAVRFNGATNDTNLSSRIMYGTGSGVGNEAPAYGYMAIIPASTATSSSFGNAELYIPNYTGATNKAFFTTGVSENNATTAYIIFSAGLWASTAAITSITIRPVFGTNLVANSSVYLYGITKA